MKKIISIIISLILVLPASLMFLAQPVSAEDKTTPTSKVLITCNPKKLEEYFKKDKAEVEKLATGQFNDLEFRLRFEKARKKYHDHVKCVFDVSMIFTLGSASGISKNLQADSLPDLSSLLPDLINPSKACLKQNEIKDVLGDTSPSTLVQPMLTTYNLYVVHLKYLYGKVGATPTISGSFDKIYANNQKFQLIVENEIHDSLVALDGAFIALKELRQAFVIHTHFQCMLKNLETYRKVVSNVRSIVEILPSIITDASMHR